MEDESGVNKTNGVNHEKNIWVAPMKLKKAKRKRRVEDFPGLAKARAVLAEKWKDPKFKQEIIRKRKQNRSLKVAVAEKPVDDTKIVKAPPKNSPTKKIISAQEFLRLIWGAKSLDEIAKKTNTQVKSVMHRIEKYKKLGIAVPTLLPNKTGRFNLNELRKLSLRLARSKNG